MQIKKRHINKILIANRGEIARRVQRTAMALNIKTLAIFSENEVNSAYVSESSEAFSLGSGTLSETYLNIDKIIEIARKAGVDAIHPGYGFLAENAGFARACESAGIIFIGPSADVIDMMGNKPEATKFAKSLGIPVVPHFYGTYRELAALNGSFPLPCIVKAAAGGGGKGMKIVNNLDLLEEAMNAASRLAESNFGDGTVYIEKYLEEPRHIEVQILADQYGKVIHLFERECSLQRHYQKIIEEAPSPSLDDKIRNKITSAAVKIARAVGYTGAGTVEFLLDCDNQFYFLEMNTRIQVEHPVTEIITGTDIVSEQISISEGNPLRMDQESVHCSGHAIEARICAEDPFNNFRPYPGKISLYLEPDIQGLRIDSGIAGTDVISDNYDSLIAKMIASGTTRKDAIQKLKIGLEKYIIHGIRTNITFLDTLVGSSDFQNNAISTNYVETNLTKLLNTLHEQEESNADDIILSAGLILSLQKFSQESDEGLRSVWNDLGYWRQVNRIPFSVDENYLLLEFTRPDEFTFEFSINSKKYAIQKEELTLDYIRFLINGRSFQVYYSEKGKSGYYLSLSNKVHTLRRWDIPEVSDNNIDTDRNSYDNAEKSVQSPISGRVVSINVRMNAKVRKGEALMVIESMKMENHIVAYKDGMIRDIMVKEGDLVSANMVLVKIE